MIKTIINLFKKDNPAKISFPIPGKILEEKSIKIDHRLKLYRSLAYQDMGLKDIVERNQKIVDMYKTGITLEEVGREFNMTRERVRQICKGIIGRTEIKKFMQQRLEKRLIKKYGSWENYIKENERLKKDRLLKKERVNAWHWKYDACLGCGTIDKINKPLKSHGRCDTCVQMYNYHNLPGRKERHAFYVKNWTNKNKDRIKAWQKEYMKEYMQRPGIREKYRARAKEKQNSPERKAWAKEYYKRPEVKERRKLYMQQPEVKAKLKLYNQRPEIRLKKKLYAQTPKFKAFHREYYSKNKEKIMLQNKKYRERKAEVN